MSEGRSAENVLALTGQHDQVDAPATTEHAHPVAVASMEWRELLRCIESRCEHWPIETVVTALFFTVAGMESDLRDLRERDGVDSRRLGRAVTRLIQIAPANSKRKTVATADVQAIWQEAQNA